MSKLEVYGSSGAKKLSVVQSDPDLDAHLADASDAHDASAISVLDSGALYAATDVEAALAEVAAEAGLGATATGEGIFRKSLRTGSRAWIYNDFFGVATIGASTSGQLGDIVGDARGTNSSINSSTQPALAVNHPGVIELNTGSVATNKARLMSGFTTTLNTPFVFGTGRIKFGIWVRIPTLSTGTQQFTLIFGLNSADSLTLGDGMYFKYSDDINSGKWTPYISKDGVETAGDSSVTVAVDTWYKLEFDINAAASSHTWAINGASATAPATNPKTGTADPVGLLCGIYKRVGTTARTCFIDAVYLDVAFDTAR